MKRIFLSAIICCTALVSHAQLKNLNKKYPSLLWEITGNGMKKPSYLIGTMHVSSKLVFNLPDSFYLALKSAQVVALENNPETWQEDMGKYEFGSAGRTDDEQPANYLGIGTLRFYKYDTRVEKALYSNPSTINNLLYRSYGNESSDFEEDTYLDMYIFQCGKKWGKRVAGVEDYGESLRLMAEAYSDAAKDKSRKSLYPDYDENYSMEKLREAYRTGNLDLLDSINKFNSTSAAFDEKFIYRRNEIQAHNIDSIMKSGSTLFVGVGAAHLPGDRGVIEILRRAGYKLRPVKMGERSGREKDLIDRIRVPVTFRTETAADGLYKVDVPGKLFKSEDEDQPDQVQYADMSNGSFYMVTRIMTNAWMWGHSTDRVYKTIDSLLYENIPGKIIAKTAITRSGYKGFDITNRTRRGDVQRYNIFVTPFEIIFFKMSGNGDYVKNGTEAERFFSSIRLNEYRNSSNTGASSWSKYTPSFGGFSINMPHAPFIGNDGSMLFDATDKVTNTNYRVIRTDIHNYGFLERDSFDLGLMDESFGSSDFIGAQLKRRQTIIKNYPALDAEYLDKNGGTYLVRYIIKGPHYYTLIAHGANPSKQMYDFLDSFEITPFIYGNARYRKDTSLYYSVTSPVFPEPKKIKLSYSEAAYGYGDDDTEDESEENQLEEGVTRTRVITADSTGEKIAIEFLRYNRYYSIDTAYYRKRFGTGRVDSIRNRELFYDSDYRVSRKKEWKLPDQTIVREWYYSDSLSSRAFWEKMWQKDGIVFTLTTQVDTLNTPSQFLKQFYETFSPADTLKGMDLFSSKSTLFFEDFKSTDTLRHKLALGNISSITLRDEDLNGLKLVIDGLNWKEKGYLKVKCDLITKLRNFSSKESVDYLRNLYFAAGDTVQIQYAVLEALVQQQNSYSYNAFRDIIRSEPPVLISTGNSLNSYRTESVYNSLGFGDFDSPDGEFMDDLSDSLQLTRTILPDLLPLLNLDDYKGYIMQLLEVMIDSNLIRHTDYEQYFNKFLLEAKQELKKQATGEMFKSIKKAEEEKSTDKNPVYRRYSYNSDNDEGNSSLSQYAALLLPFSETNSAVKPVLEQMLRSSDKKLKYSVLLLLIKHNKPFPDSLLRYFASMDEYRYSLYSDLLKSGKKEKFPGLYNNHLDLAKSYVYELQSYNKPDSVVYLDKLPAQDDGKKGWVYFFKYKKNEDDAIWYIASVGLLPEDPAKFEFENPGAGNSSVWRTYAKWMARSYSGKYLSELTNEKLNQESKNDQLKKILKKLLYSRTRSAQQFYGDSNIAESYYSR